MEDVAAPASALSELRGESVNLSSAKARALQILNFAAMKIDERRRRLLAGEAVAETFGPAPWRAQGPLLDQIRAGGFATPTVKRWRGELDRIRLDISDILLCRQVMSRLRDIVAGNERLQGANLLLDRILRWYASSVLVLMAREVGTGRGTVSLWRLLDDIRRNPDELSRARYRLLHTGSSQLALPNPNPFEIDPADIEGQLLEKSYDAISAPPRCQALKIGIVEEEIAELDAAADKVRQLRHTEYAHRAAGGPALPSIELQTIHDLIDVAERLVTKYTSVLLYEATRLEPVDQTNWTSILGFPWIESTRNTHVPYTATPELVIALFEALRPEERARVCDLLNQSNRPATG